MYDVIIIGAGPAGLMAGMLLKNQNANFMILEKGKKHARRSINNSEDVSFGCGGAGLFSDGKLSYAPSATHLWNYLNPKLLKTAYENVSELFLDNGFKLDEWDNDWISGNENETTDSYIKKYKSVYLTKPFRDSMIDFFEKKLEDHLRTNATVKNISYDNTNNTYIVRDGNNEYSTQNVVVATGKISIWDLLGDNIDKNGYFQAEMGVRAEVNKEDSLIVEDKCLDYKKIRQIDKNSEFRTFCYCKEGKIIRSRYGEHISYNGDGSTNKESGLSNIGLLVRAKEDSVYLEEMKKTFQDQDIEKDIMLQRYGVDEFIIGSKTDSIIRESFQELFSSEARGHVVGPEIEKYGIYPYLNKELMLQKGLYFIGDSCSQFRGLLAAFVSGAYVANEIEEDRKTRIELWKKQYGIKQSSMKQLKTVFTAQSKNNFFCKDAICEYVFNNGYLPVNPFNVFGYFLGDRVERDLVRRGNNQLIRMCDELWIFGIISDGVLFEIVSAIEQRKKIRFFTCDSRASDIKELDIKNITFEPEVHAKQIKKQDIIEFILNNGNITDQFNYTQLSLYNMDQIK